MDRSDRGRQIDWLCAVSNVCVERIQSIFAARKTGACAEEETARANLLIHRAPGAVKGWEALLVLRKVVPLRLFGLLVSAVLGFSSQLQAQSFSEEREAYVQQPSFVIRHSRPLWATDENVVGHIKAERSLRPMVLVLAASAEQEAEIQNLVEDQHDKHSSNYHHWLTAAEFGRRFGAADAGIEQARAWLESAGLHVDAVATGRRWLEFSGIASQVEAAFHTKMQYYRVHGQLHIANSTDIALPASLSGISGGVFSLNSLGKRPPVTRKGVKPHTQSDTTV